jgi:glycosyltransferase involved in cell wall biosynthesis
MKRILLAVHNAEAGGAQLLALADARRLAPDFDLTISVPDGTLRPDFAEYGDLVAPTAVSPIWGASPTRWALQSTRTVRDAVRLARMIRRRGIKLVLVNSTVLMAPVLAARLAGVPAIVQVREFPMTTGGRRVFGLHRRLADTLIAISGAVEDELPDGGGARVVRILAGIDIPAQAGKPRDDFQKPVRLCVVGSVNGAHSKGQDVAVGALGWLAQRGVDASLDLVGPISDESFAAELRESAAKLGVADRVHIRGESRETDAVFAATDIVLMCSRIEPLGLVPAEALVRGRPVIAARTGGLPEVVNDGETGILVPPEDPEALGGAVLKMISSPAETREMVVRGRRDVERRLDLEKSLDLIHKEVAGALERRNLA